MRNGWAICQNSVYWTRQFAKSLFFHDGVHVERPSVGDNIFTEYPGLEGTQKDHPSPTAGPAQGTSATPPCDFAQLF